MILDQVIAAIGAAFTAATTSGTVFDGPVPSSANKQNYILVGSTGDEGEDGATVSLELSDLGPGTWHNESGEVSCSTWSWSGGNDIAARRAIATADATACANAIHADRTLGGLLTEPGLAQVSDLAYSAHQFAEGVLCRVVFTVTYSHLNT